MRILLLGDSRWRDNPTLLFVKQEIEKINAEALVQIASFDIYQPVLELFKPHVVVLNHVIGQRNRDIANWVKRHNGMVAVMPTEGRPNSHSQENWFYEQLENDDLDIFFAWSDLTPQYEAKVVVTGCPRFEVFTNRKEYIQSRELFCARHGIDPQSHIVGIASSYPQAKFSYSNVQFNINDWKDLGVDTIDGRDDPLAFAQREYKKFQSFKLHIHNLVESYRKKYKNVAFMLKPHPMEDVHQWETFCDDLRIKIIRQEYLFNFVCSIDDLIARYGCITIQEAWMAEKNVIQISTDDYKDTDSDPAAEAFWVGETRGAQVLTFVGEDAARKYLHKYGYIGHKVPPSQLIGEKLCILAGSAYPEDMSISDYVNLSKLLTEHAVEHIYPNPYIPTPLGKSVIPFFINELAAATS